MITIVGGGNMGGAIAKAFAKSEQVKDAGITVIERDQQKVDAFNRLGIRAVSNDYAPLYASKIVVLALKPWLIESFLKEHKDLFNPTQLIVSIAAGITLAQLKEWTVAGSKVFRIIPNTAIEVGQSMTFIASEGASAEEQDVVAGLFQLAGKVEIIEEKLFPAVTALSSCGIAYAFRYIRASMEGGVELGIPSKDAKNIMIQTLRGAIDLLEATGEHPEVEIDKVTTAGGITIQGLNALEHGGFNSAIINALKASCKK